MRTARLVLIALFAAGLPVVADASPASSATPPRVETIDHGDAVEIVARGAIAASAAKVGVVRERVEIPLANVAPSTRRIIDDATALLVEIRGDSPRVLSIKLRHDHARVAAIAPTVTFAQLGDELHVTIPRNLPIAALAPVAAIAPIAAVAPVAAITPATSPAPVAALAPTPAAAGEAPTPRALATPPTANPPAPAAPAALTGGKSTGATGARWWMMLGGLALVGGGITFGLKKKGKGRVDLPENQLEIIATRSLGGKSRVVWLAAGDHEIVVAISPQQIRPIAQWARATPAVATERTRAAPVERGFGRALEDAAADFAPARTKTEPVVAPRGTSPIPRMRAVGSSPGISPALSGLLRLRDRTPVPPPMPALTDDDGDLDEDAQWARDVLEATGGRR